LVSFSLLIHPNSEKKKGCSRKFGMTALNRDDFASFCGSGHNGLPDERADVEPLTRASEWH